MIKRVEAIPPCPGTTIGMPMVVALEGIGTARGTLVGIDPGKCLIVKLPVMAEVPVKLFRENSFVIRYFHAECAYGFRTTLVGLIREPSRLFILDYPQSVESVTVRKTGRHECLVPAATWIVGTEPAERRGVIRVISVTGCSFEHTAARAVHLAEARVGAILAFSIHFPHEDKPRTLNAEVRTVQASLNKLTLGLEFAPDPSVTSHMAAMEAIQAFVKMIDGQEPGTPAGTGARPYSTSGGRTLRAAGYR